MAGKISDKNVRTMITLPKELKAELEKLAEADNRSLNNMMVTILQEKVIKSDSVK